MCLYISSDQNQNEKDLKRWFGSRKKFAYVYKILRKYSYEDFYRSEYYPSYKWDFSKQKVFQVDRPNKPTYGELSHLSIFKNPTYGEIHYGLHVYTNLKEAKRFFPSDKTIAKFRVKKEDIIAIQNDMSRKENNFKELVCRKLTFVKIIEE
jgi:hypothetical protein